MVVMALMLGSSLATQSPEPAHAVGSPTVTTLKSSLNPSPACATVTFTATVFGTLLPPLGGVQFFDGASTLGGIQFLTPDFDTFLGAHIIPTNHSSATVEVALSGGAHAITVVYAGTDVPSSAGPLAQNVTSAVSTTTVTSGVNPSVFGQPVPFSAAVSTGCAGGVAGSVQFTADGAPLGASQTLDGSGHASWTSSTLDVGGHPVTAVFTSANTDVGGSTGSLDGGQTVTPADTTTVVASSTNPAEFGAGVTFTATTAVVAPGAGTPAGVVQFQDNGANLGAAQAVNGAGQAFATTSSMSVGSHAITAAYTSGSANFNNSGGMIAQVVNRARTTLVSDGATSGDFNDASTLSATLTRSDNSAPISGRTVALSMASEACTAITDANGQAHCAIVPVEPSAAYSAGALFSGDSNYLAATAAATSFAVLHEETTVTYTGPTVIAQGGPVTMSAQLLEDGDTPIAGRALTLTIGTGSGSQSCITSPTDAVGDAHCTISSVSVTQGPQPVAAVFAGDAYYLASRDATKNVIIFAFPARGAFVVAGKTTPLTPVTYWGAQWPASAITTGSTSSFKGFANTISTTRPSCGGTWTSNPGDSSAPVDTVPAYMGTVVTGAVSTNGGITSGTIAHIVVVLTARGYSADPGHPGTGTIIATYC